MNERQSKILELLANGQQDSVNALARELSVSSVTIRQDLAFLEQEGLVKRVHGGAVLGGSDDIRSRLGVNYENKIRVARRAASLVEDGETIFLESGSVNALLAKELLRRKSLTVLTTNLFIAREMRKGRHIQVIVVGGIYQHESESLVGQLTKAFVEQVNFGKAFIGIDGFSPSTGFTCKDMMRAEISARIIERSQEAFIITDSSKFGRSELQLICPTEQIDCVITDDGIPEESKEFLHTSNVKILLA